MKRIIIDPKEPSQINTNINEIEILKQLNFPHLIRYYKSFVHKNTLSNQPLLESLIIKANEDKNNIICENLNKYTPYDEYIITENLLNDYYDFQKRTYEMFYDDNDITMEQFISFIQDCIKFEPLDMTLEAAGRNMTRNAQKKLRKINNKVNGSRNTLGKNLNRLDDKASDIVNRKLDSIINTGRDLAREKMVEGRPQVKISRFIRNGILGLASASGAVALLGPATGAIIVAIGLLCRQNLKKNTEKREKKRLLLELETELKLTKEKIEDAKSENDKKKKYQLMRIESTLEKEITRIKYGLRYY